MHRFGLAILSFAILANLCHGRPWTDASGKKIADGEFVELAGSIVRLKRDSGAVLSVPLSKLSKADQDFIAQQAGASPPAQGKNPVQRAPQKPARKTADDLERNAQQCKRAVEALQLYEAFLNDPKLEPAQKAQAIARLDFWKNSATKQLTRVGTKWLSAEEKQELQSKTSALIAGAWDMVELGNNDAARDKLLEASRLNPDSMQADFVLGLLNALVARHAPSAEKHFKECLRRSPDHVSVLNNLALSEVRQKQYSEAFKHWRAAMNNAPASSEMIQNIGRLLWYSNRGRLQLPKDVEKQFNELYTAAVSSSPDAGTFDSTTGWLYMRFFMKDEEPDANAKVEHPPGKEADPPKADGAKRDDDKKAGKPEKPLPRILNRIVVGNGSGFVVHPGVILTNRHVADGATGFQILLNGEKKRRPATLIAKSKSEDLALLQCAELNAPSLPIVSSEVRIGTEIMVLGYPSVTELGTTLKATRGSVTSVPSAEFGDLCMLDAIANPGNSGGPVCDSRGTVLGVLTGVSTNQRLNYTLAVPAPRLIDFVKQHVKEFKSHDSAGDRREWEDVAETAGKSTVVILIEQDAFEVRLQKSTQPIARGKKPASSLEDRWCIFCNGKGTLDCPHVGCAQGKVLVPKTRQVATNKATGQPIYETIKVRARCPTCRGDGAVDCQFCTNGVERD